MPRLLGHFLLWVGFLAAAFWTVFRLEIKSDKWSTIPWLWYGLSMAVGVAGIVLLRSLRPTADDAAVQNNSDYMTLENSLRQLADGVTELQALAKTEKMSQVVAFIDDRLAEPFEAFADARKALANLHGLQFYADVMTPFASAERYVNRAWSAAADGYIDEVVDSANRAEAYLAEASLLMKAVKSAGANRK